MTRWLSGQEVADWAESLVPGSVARVDPGCCVLKPEALVETMRALRTSPQSDLVYLTNLCGVDWWDHFEVAYHLQSFDLNHIATIKCEAWDHDKPSLPSLVPVFHGAWMQESEAYDLLGIRFDGHPNLQRIFLWEGYPGHPLRKDFVSMPGGLQPGLGEFAGINPRPEPPTKVVG